LKPVAAVAGATYCITTEATTVDGAVYDPPRRLDLSPTVPTPVGCATVPPEHVFVLSTVPGSYDSRYYGPVPVSLIQAVYEPLWTF
ncbi:S26 family signal peptidase, partial [Acinetobacter baumannii]